MTSESIDHSTDFPHEFRALVGAAVGKGASDIHLVPDRPPALRLHGMIATLTDEPWDSDRLNEIAMEICDDRLRKQLEIERQVDCSLHITVGDMDQRFRVNMFHVGHGVGICLRLIPGEIPTFDWAGFSTALAGRLTTLLDGLVILTGATGSGKTTSLAMLIDMINRSGGKRIITIEEPVEYLFAGAPNSLVTQREVGVDVLSFADGLRSGVRQDPDVILVGEVRDQETAEMVLSAAETGHLVFTTLHTRDCKGAISRFAGLFPQSAQQDIRYQLSLSLQAVVAQRLLPSRDALDKRQLATEVMWNTNPIASAIRNSKLESIDNYLITNRHDGMLSFDESVSRLFRDGRISREVAERNVREVAFLDRTGTGLG